MYAARIMVLLPSEAATDATLVGRLVDASMDVARMVRAADDAGATTGRPWRRWCGQEAGRARKRSVRTF